MINPLLELIFIITSKWLRKWQNIMEANYHEHLRHCIPPKSTNKSLENAHLQSNPNRTPHTHYQLVRSFSHVFRDGLFFCLNAEYFHICRTLRLSLWWWWAPQHSSSLNIILHSSMHIYTYSHLSVSVYLPNEKQRQLNVICIIFPIQLCFISFPLSVVYIFQYIQQCKATPRMREISEWGKCNFMLFPSSQLDVNSTMWLFSFEVRSFLPKK